MTKPLDHHIGKAAPANYLSTACANSARSAREASLVRPAPTKPKPYRVTQRDHGIIMQALATEYLWEPFEDKSFRTLTLLLDMAGPEEAADLLFNTACAFGIAGLQRLAAPYSEATLPGLRRFIVLAHLVRTEDNCDLEYVSLPEFLEAESVMLQMNGSVPTAEALAEFIADERAVQTMIDRKLPTVAD